MIWVRLLYCEIRFSMKKKWYEAQLLEKVMISLKNNLLVRASLILKSLANLANSLSTLCILLISPPTAFKAFNNISAAFSKENALYEQFFFNLCGMRMKLHQLQALNLRNISCFKYSAKHSVAKEKAIHVLQIHTNQRATNEHRNIFFCVKKNPTFSLKFWNIPVSV